MKSIFVIRNQHGLYLNKQHEWVEGREAASLYRTPHRDEAINTVFEASIRDISIRAEVVACRLDERNLPRVDERAPSVATEDELSESAAAAITDPVSGDGDPLPLSS